LLGVTPFGGNLVKRFKTKLWQEGVYVHNAYLQVWLVYGLLGFILFIVLYWKSIRLGLELFNHKGLPYGLILFTFCCAQSTKNIIWPTAISHMNITLVYIFIISLAIRMKEIHHTHHTHHIRNRNEHFNNARLAYSNSESYLPELK
jgi:O-antigen ligase